MIFNEANSKRVAVRTGVLLLISKAVPEATYRRVDLSSEVVML